MHVTRAETAGSKQARVEAPAPPDKARFGELFTHASRRKIVQGTMRRRAATWAECGALSGPW
jgi:hypothetical protein